MEVGGDNVEGLGMAVRIVLYTFLYHSNFEPYKCFMYSKNYDLITVFLLCGSSVYSVRHTVTYSFLIAQV